MRGESFRPCLHVLGALVAGALLAAPLHAQFSTTLKPETVRAFEKYERSAEASLAKRNDGSLSYLWLQEHPNLRDQTLKGEISIERLEEDDVPDGLIHDWVAAMYVPGATIRQFVAVFQDYADYPKIYPQVIRSKVESRQPAVFNVYQRLLKKSTLTVVLDTWHRVRYEELDSKRYLVNSKTLKIQQVKNAGEPDETLLPPGEGGGFLWRMNLYWRLEQAAGGVFAECRSLSLSRDIPTGLGWIIKPVVGKLPRKSLEESLQSTRRAVMELD